MRFTTTVTQSDVESIYIYITFEQDGESFDVGAYSSDGEQYWRINSVTVSYDEVLLGVNPMYVRVWEEAVE